MIAVVVILQLAATLFFLIDVTGDLRAEGSGVHIAAEAGAAVALLVGVLFGATQVRWLVMRARQDEAAVAAAKGALADLARLRFSDWKLTAAESDVALFALKGCDVTEIAALRGSATGTVRAQLTRVYAKAGVNSQSALMALFMDELVETAAG